MIGYLLLLSMAIVSWYAWPAAPSIATKAYTILLATLLCPFSWPWLIARGHKTRKLRRTIEANSKRIAAEQLRRENIEWWRSEYHRACTAEDAAAMQLALDVLAQMGDSVCRCGNCTGRGTSYQP